MQHYGPNPQPRHPIDSRAHRLAPDTGADAAASRRGLVVFAWIFGVWATLTIIGLGAWLVLADG